MMENNVNEGLNIDSTVQQEPQMAETSAKKKVRRKNPFSSKIVKITISVLIPLIIIGGCISAYLFTKTPKYIAAKYAKALSAWDYSTICDLTVFDWKEYVLSFNPELNNENAYFEYCAELNQEDITSWEDLFAVWEKGRMEFLEDQYGKFKVEVEVTREKDVSAIKVKNERQALLQDLKDKIDFETGIIDDYKLVTVKVRYVGEDEVSKKMTTQICMCKVDGTWKILDNSAWT